MLKKVIPNLLMLLLGILMALFAMEIFLRLFLPQLPLQLKGMYIADPALGFRLKPGFEGRQRTDEFDVAVEINSWGFRDYERPIDPDRFTVLAVGDSFFFGSWVELDVSCLAVLEDLLSERMFEREVQVIKAGVPAYGVDQASLFVQHDGANYSPELVILGLFVGNDVRDTLVGPGLYGVEDGLIVWDPSVLEAWWGYDVITGEWPDKPLEWPPTHWRQISKSTPTDWLKKNSHLYHFARRMVHLTESSAQSAEERRPIFWPSQTDGLTIFDYETYYLKDYPAEIEKGFELTFDYIKQLKVATEVMGAELLLVLIPTKAQVYPSYWEMRMQAFDLAADLVDPDNPQRKIRDWASEHQIRTLDLLPAFRQVAARANDLLYFEEDKHWNENGHRLAAEIIYAYLAENHLVQFE